MDVCTRPTWAKGHGCAPMAVELAGSWGLALQLPATHAAVAHRGAKGEFVPAQHTIGRRSRMSAVHHYPIHMQTQKSANTVSGMASTPSVYIYIWLYENIIDLKQSCFLLLIIQSFRLISMSTVLIQLPAGEVRSALSESLLLSLAQTSLLVHTTTKIITLLMLFKKEYQWM